jgi:hypothetical protein
LNDGFVVNAIVNFIRGASLRDYLQPSFRSSADKFCFPPPSRRQFIQVSALAAASAMLATTNEFRGAISKSDGFIHRAYNGWITDLATQPDPEAEWPSRRVDESLLADYRTTLPFLKRYGFKEIVIWGLYVSNNWPIDLKSAVPRDRGRMMERLIEIAHDQGIRVLSGLGTYSWGFKEIIRANPKLNGGNPNAMCASEPESHEWMRRIVNFEFERFPIDGVSMQSADLGRCSCLNCSALNDAAYHAALITRTAEYIRSKWPGKILGMSNWGVSFGRPQDQETFARMSQRLDYIIDQNNSVHEGGKEYQRDFIRALACPFGTTGGLVVEPPQHWPRNRWFLPTCRHVHRHLQQLAANGGRAVEFFYHILANPSSEATFHLAGQTLVSPTTSLENHMKNVLDELYQPRTARAREGLVDFFLDAEDAFFQQQDVDSCGTISLEPLASSVSGPPIYLRDRLSKAQRALYGARLEKLAAQFSKLRGDLRSVQRCLNVLICLRNVQNDLAALS